MTDAVSGRAGTAGDEAAGDARGASGERPARPRILADTGALGAAVGTPDERGAVWRLDDAERHLDANVIALPPGERIDDHVGPEEDVLLHVIAGSGALRSGDEELPLTVGTIVWLPRRSRREITAGADGLRYLSVHRRKPGLRVGRRP
ncbi:cupin domain-containing protein [Agrococcus sp. DT81.2]|uniref:cupin domain-containing protein n=1 Tax=Agrococcus sp. DT81.2 TaxID=3393414 RepID=UPI003CE49628